MKPPKIRKILVPHKKIEQLSGIFRYNKEAFGTIERKAKGLGAKPTTTGFSFGNKEKAESFITQLKEMKMAKATKNLSEQAKMCANAFRKSGEYTEKQIKQLVDQIIYNKY